jgi:membrane protease YdiL (CAAX protease family)
VRFVAWNPITRILVAFVVIGGSAAVLQELLRPIRLGRDQPITAASLFLDSVGSFLVAGAVLGTYVLYARLYERRWPTEVGIHGLWRWLMAGFAIGAGLQLSAALLVHLGGWSTVSRVTPSVQWAGLIVLAFVGQFAVGCFEEVLLRGDFFGIVEEALGSWLALGLSALLFGLLHLGNENATWIFALGLSIQAGVLLAAAYMASRSLWLAIGIHWAWNAVQAGIIGGTVSGRSERVIVATQPVGSDFLSGGSFGIEGSIISTALCAALGGLFCYLACRHGQLRSGFWAERGTPKRAEPGAAPDPAGT